MTIRCAAVVAAALALVASPARAQLVAPVAVQHHVSMSRSLAAPIEPEADHVGAAPFVILGALVGAGAVTAFWIHDMQVSARENGNDGFFIPPIVFVTIGAGGVGGGLLGWIIHDAATQPH
jgi:hypothetical protein